MKESRVAGCVTVSWQVMVPDGAVGEACDDVAVEAVLSALGTDVDVFINGLDSPPCRVTVEVFEEDVEVEEDDR